MASLTGHVSRLLLAVILIAPIVQLRSQNAVLLGKVIDKTSRAPLGGVYLRLIQRSDTTHVRPTASANDGTFSFTKIPPDFYRLEVNCIGYSRLRIAVRIDRPAVDLGALAMVEGLIPLDEVLVEGTMPPAIQKADTTELFAKAFKTHRDADVGELIQKMPGITVDNSGTVQAHGETVQQILVDGKPFFGGDPTIAMRNLPAEAVEKIQVFDKMSDQAEFTGFDDGQTIKTMNIVLRPDRRRSQFGKVYAGYGDDARYAAGGNANWLQDAAKVSAIAISNNINQQNFSQQDLLGVLNSSGPRGQFGGGARRGSGGGRGGGGSRGPSLSGSSTAGSFLVGQQSGITSTSSLGENYTDLWGTGLAITQSYFFNKTDNENGLRVNRTYVASADSLNLYTQQSTSANTNSNHRFDTRVEYTVDSMNSIIDQPRLYVQRNQTSSSLLAANAVTPEQLINQGQNASTTTTTGNNFSNNLVLRHKFEAPGRTVSLSIGVGSNHRSGSGSIQTLTRTFSGATAQTDTQDQRSAILVDGRSISARVAYTEPLWVNSMLQFTYSPSYSTSSSDNRRHRVDPLTGEYALLDTSLSNTYDNASSAQNAGLTYMLHWTGFNLTTGLSYQRSTLEGTQVFPRAVVVDKTFHTFLPSVTMNLTIGDHRNIRLFYRTATRVPGIGQLQNVIDNTNPLLLRTGNPDLRQTYDQTLVSRYSWTDVMTAESFFLMFSYQQTGDYIANSTVTAIQDTVLNGGVTMSHGTQLTVPVNLDGYWNVRSFATYSLPVGFVRSILNLNGGVSCARVPGLVNRLGSTSRTTTLSAGAVLSSNISEDVDFTLSYMGNDNLSRNSLQSSLNRTYYSHTAGVRLNLVFWEGIILRTDAANTLYSGLGGSSDQNYILWNASLGKRLFPDERGELRLTATDLLRQNKSVTRTITETYVEDAQNRILGPYIILTFTYTMR